ncbi:hypothetical protein CRYUN_Cryun05aG0187100 [Craigia yunnanensis]
MPSVGLRRTTRVFRMVKSSEVRVLRSGRQLWPDSGEVKPKRPNNDGDEYYHSMKKPPKSEVNKAASELNGKPKRLGHEENPKKQSRKMKAEARNDGASVDRMFGIVYTRKRKRNKVQKSQLSGNSEQKKFGKSFNRKQISKRRKINKDVEESRMFAFVVGNGDCYGWFSSFLCLVLGYVKRAEVRFSELAAFLMSQPISGVYSSNGVNLFWGPPANRTGICKFSGAKDFIPLFHVDFSAVPHCFMYMHHSTLLRLKRVQLVPLNSDEIMSDSEEDEPCVTSVVDVSKSTSGSTVVKIDNLGSKVVLHPSVRAFKLTGRNAQYRNGLSSRSIQKRRSSLRRRRTRNPSLVGIHKANGALMSDLISSRRNGIPFSSVVSKNKLRSSVRNSSANLSDVSSYISDLMPNVDSSQCSANILVVEPERCYREEGAIVKLELSSSREWLLVVKKDRSTKYAHKADKSMRPSSCNRYTHAIIWTGDDNWKLEFANRQDWAIFKDLYKECSERNVPASTVKVIPVPGVREVSGYGDRGSVQFHRPDLYLSLDGDEVSRALAKRTANYDMDSEDEEWLKKFNSEFFSGNGHCEHLSEDCFELMVDAFEKAYFCSPDDYSNENAVAHLCLDLASGEVVEAVHAYWLRKRKQRRSALLRVFQGHQVKKAPLVPKSFLRKRRSFKRQASHVRGKQPSLLQALAAEYDTSAEQNAMVKVEEARVSATRSVESAILKRQRAQLLMQNADMAIYKAMMALRVAEAAPFTESSQDAVAQFFIGDLSVFVKRNLKKKKFTGSFEPIVKALKNIDCVSEPTVVFAIAVKRKTEKPSSMASALAGDDLARSMSSRSMSRRMSLGSGSRRGWASASIREAWNTQTDVFQRSGREEDEEELKWAAIERLPTYDRLRKGMLKHVLDEGKVGYEEVDIANLDMQDKKNLMENILRVVEEDNERFLHGLRERTDRVGIDVPKIEVRFEHLSIEGDAYLGTRALPTLLNSTLNTIEGVLGLIKLFPSKKRVVNILRDVSGIVKPSRMTLLLGPPGSGKTTLLQALAGKMDTDLRVSGKITYCGNEFREFIPQRTSAYISQHDLHHGEMSVRETLDFSGRCLGVGTRYELLAELSRREKQAGIKPDPEIDAFMKATAMAGQKTSLVTDYVLKILGLDICSDIMVGDEMRRGISGGQKKRVTTGEMLVGPAKALFMDEISTGLDSSTTFQIVRFMKQMVHIMDVTMIISLLQPAPETYDLFDDIILLSEGKIVYQGPRENVLEFFESVGFKCPERKGVADFLQEVTSGKDQQQYWCRKKEPYQYISVPELVEHFNSFHIGQKLDDELRVPYDKSKTHPAALVKEKYGISNWELFKACFAREWLLMKRNSFVYIFKTTQITIMSVIAFTVFFRTKMKTGHVSDGVKFYGALFFSLINVMFNGMAELALTIFRLPVFFKQRDFMFYPAWAFALPIWVLRIPLSLLESGIWIILTYYTIGFAPAASRFFRQFLAFFGIHQMALSLFRFIAAVGRTQVVANTLGTFTLLVVFVLGGFVVAKDDIKPWMIWGYYVSPMSYGQNAIVITEFLDKRWSAPYLLPSNRSTTVGKILLKSRGMYTEEYWYWICVAALLGFSLLFNLCFIWALTYLNPLGDSKAVILDEDDESKSKKQSSSVGKHNLKSIEMSSPSTAPLFEGTNMAVKNTPDNSILGVADQAPTKRGMVLPFQPLSIAFDHVNYYVDMPAEMKSQGVEETRLQLLRDVSGAFRPGVLTALVGVSGAGKTTLMDVLAGRKTGGYIEGSISISGYPKNQETFARVSGYCEQNDIHSPHVTVYESLVYSAWLRLAKDVNEETRKMFVEEVMELVELNPLKNSLVGLPGVDGLSTEQRKRLTIAVELVANPSIIFMDEPTSGLDARAAAIVMRTVRNTVDTGRTVVCTIHQPSIDIFEAFDELFLMKRGGQVIYAGSLGRHSHKLIEYFEDVPGVPKIKEGYNPATWMLEISSTAVEAQLDVDFAEIYGQSELYWKNEELIKDLSTPVLGTKDLHFPTTYSQDFFTQCKACFWKQHHSYWRNPQYNAIRFFMTFFVGIIFGMIFWDKGDKIHKQQDLMNLLGAMYSAVLFLGATNTSAVQSVVAIERTVFYRERAAGMYSPLPYAFAQVAIEAIYVSIQTLVYSIILYSMIGFHMDVGKFFLFYYFILMCFMYFTLYGMMLVALTPNHQFAAIVMSFFLSFWNLFSGFLIPRTEIPIWWRWYYWASPVAWTIYGLVTSQVGDKLDLVEIPGEFPMTVKAYLETHLGFKYDFLPAVIAAHIGWVLLFLFVFAYGIKFLNFQRR